MHILEGFSKKTLSQKEYSPIRGGGGRNDDKFYDDIID